MTVTARRETVVRAQLFVTCMVDLFRPRAGVAAVQVLERRGVEVEFPGGQSCCGQFAYNAGHHREAAAMGRQLVRAFEPSDAATSPADPPTVIALSGSCAAMIKHEMPELLERDALQRGRTLATATRWRRRAETLADRVVELSVWLDRQAVLEPEGVGTHAESGGPASSGGPGYAGASIGSTPLKVASHTGCHMRRLLGVTEAPLSVLRCAGVAPVELDDAEQCCGFGGSFGLLEPDISAAMADAKLANLATARGDGVACLVSSDLGCLMQLGGRLDRQGDAFPMLHLAEAVDLADRHRLTPADIERTARSQEADPDAR
jgi:L-lactate dehydrogenase complex protein LldE